MRHFRAGEPTADPSPLVTSPTLLGRLKAADTDQPAWAEFVLRYGRLLHRWCRDWRLPEGDAEEVTQAVLVKLAQKMRTFTYDRARSFRAYLKTLARYAWCDFLQERRRLDCGSGDPSDLRALEDIEASDDLARRLDERF